jgi:hypothetical protein
VADAEVADAEVVGAEVAGAEVAGAEVAGVEVLLGVTVVSWLIMPIKPAVLVPTPAIETAPDDTSLT